MPQVISDAVAQVSSSAQQHHETAAASNGHSSGFGSDVTAPHVDAMDYDADASSSGAGGVTFKPLWEGSTIDRREFVRLALQTFKEMGYTGTAQSLQKESGFVLESPSVSEFRQGILRGEWETVEKLLASLPSHELSDLTVIKFLIRQQKFLEALEAHETKKALSVLRNELALLNYDSDRLHFLSSLIMCASPEDLRARASWDGVAGKSREKLLVMLQDWISPTLLIPQRRLETLLEQAKAEQRRHCPFHTHDVHISLLTDCKCDPGQFPSFTTRILTEHTDEIWRLEFSHDGKWLATAGRDKTAMIWNVEAGFSLDKILRDHDDFISCLAWSPDDSVLLTVAESIIKMWNTSTGKCIATLAEHEYQIGAIAWLPDGQGFVSGGMDSRVYFWDLAGNVIGRLPNSPSRVIDLAISPDGKKLVAVGRADTSLQVSRAASTGTSRGATPAQTPPIITRHEKRISVFSLPDKKLIMESVQPNELTSVSVSDDSRFAIVSHAPNEILYVDLRDGTIVRRYAGHDQGQYVLQSCFGGALQNFVLSGSEDGKVYVWHRDTGALIHQLVGHGRGSVNAVSWNKRHRGMFASASDDRTIRIWEAPPAPK